MLQDMTAENMQLDNGIQWDRNQTTTTPDKVEKNEPVLKLVTKDEVIKVVRNSNVILRKYDEIKKPELVERLTKLENVDIPPKYRLLQMKREELRQLLINHTRYGADNVQHNKTQSEATPAEIVQHNDNIQPNETKPAEPLQPNETKPAEPLQPNETKTADNVQQDEPKPADGVKLPMRVFIHMEPLQKMTKCGLVTEIVNNPHLPFLSPMQYLTYKKDELLNIINKYLIEYNNDDEETQNKKYESMKILKYNSKSEKEKRKIEADARRECMEINAKIDESMKQRELIRKEKEEARDDKIADAIAQTILINRELEYNINHATKCINDLIKFVEYAKTRMT